MINEDGLSIIESHCDQLACCYCGTTHVIKWGKSGNLQRYKCHESSCSKTFNALTGTPLANLRSKDKWLRYFSCMIDGLTLTLRKCASRLNINLTTAFR